MVGAVLLLFDPFGSDIKKWTLLLKRPFFVNPVHLLVAAN